MDIEAEVKAKRAGKVFTVSVKVDPMPQNCYECPFFYNIDGEMGWEEHWNCFLGFNEDCWGIALNRHVNCPLEEI